MLKKFILSFCACFFIVYNALAQWEWLNPRPSGYSCAKIFFTDSLRGLILSTNGDLLKTTDQGTHWNYKDNFPNAVSMDVKDSVAAITAYGTFYISKDSGNTWQKKASIPNNYFAVDVVSSDTIFLAMTNGTIYRTYNGGSSWQSVNCGIVISSIEFINSKVGFVGGSSKYILKTTDGGATWQQSQVASFVPSSTKSIRFVDLNTGFAFTESSGVLSTIDGGLTWKQYSMHDNLYAFHFISPGIGFACGEYGVSYRTNDGGQTWTLMGAPVRIYAYDLYSIYFLNSNTGFTVGARGRILKTTDGGTTWNTYSPSYNDVNDVAIPVNSTAYATIANMIYKTADTGKTWQPLGLTVGTNYGDYSQFKKCYFFDADTGFVTASLPARTYKTYDGGVTWKQISPTQYGYDDVSDLQFLNKNLGYLAINNYYGGTIVKTKDQGETWKPVWSSQYYGEVFQKIYFVDEKTGYASRQNSLYKTEDSAKTWTQLWQDQTISSIWFTNARTGFVSGENGMLKRTNDSGKTWKQIPINSQYYDDIYNIKFIDERVGYLTGEGGAIYKSIDTGLTWKLSGRGSYYRLGTIQFGTDSSVYVAGEYGSILRSDAREYRIDSFQVSTQNSCATDLRAFVAATLTSVDSLRFEYGVNGFNQTAIASPASIFNSQQQVKASVSNLLPSTTYKFRLRLLFEGRIYYSDENSFRTPDRPAKPVISPNHDTAFCAGDSIVLKSSATSGNQWFLGGALLTNANSQTYVAKLPGQYQLLRTVGCYTSDTSSAINVVQIVIPPAPVISVNGNVLTSSVTAGNQWYLNGVPIAGATTVSYAPLVSGIYSVNATSGNCPGPLSAPVNFAITGINSPDFAEKFSIGPNPVNLQLTIAYSGNTGSFLVFVTDMWGRRVYQHSFKKMINVDMSPFEAGFYVVQIINQRTMEEARKIIIKQ
jgi:photosystem II stability/assembly factor-like uncharacterized protein